MLRRWTILAVLALVACGTGGWFLQREYALGADVYRQARFFEDVLAHVRDYQVDSVPESELYRRAAVGMLKELRDPYAALLTGKDWDRLQERTTGDYAGVGLQMDARNGWITVVTPMQGSPAERAGIRSGDLLTEVDGQTAAGWTLERAVQSLRGVSGSSVDVAVRREGTEAPLHFRLVRERIHQRAVPQEVLLDGGVGYLGMAEHAQAVQATHRSDAGRLLAGGGGIVPDVLLRPDTLSTPEQRFARALDGQVPVFRDVLTAYALELRRSTRLPNADFAVSAAENGFSASSSVMRSRGISSGRTRSGGAGCRKTSR